MNKLDIENKTIVSVLWEVKEDRGGLWVPVARTHNLQTNFGLTAYAQAPFGAYIPPIYLVIDTAFTTLYAGGNIGDIVVFTATDPTLAGDTQLVLSPGLASQETVSFTSKTGTGPYTFSGVSPLVNTHTIGDPVVRAPTTADTMLSVVSEAQYDPTFNPGNRATLIASFTPATGQGTGQFFLSGLTATNLYFAHVGLADQLVIGAPNTNLHNYAALGYNHNTTADLEIDVTYTLQTF